MVVSLCAILAVVLHQRWLRQDERQAQARGLVADAVREIGRLRDARREVRKVETEYQRLSRLRETRWFTPEQDETIDRSERVISAARADREFARMLRIIEPWRDDTIVIVTSDHGEELGEHGWWIKHGHHLHDVLLRVPLVVAGPGIVRGEWPGIVFYDQPEERDLAIIESHDQLYPIGFWNYFQRMGGVERVEIMRTLVTEGSLGTADQIRHR